VNQLSFQVELEVSSAVLRHQLEQVVAVMDVPLRLEKPIGLTLGRLHDGRVSAFELEDDAVHLELRFAGNSSVGVRLTDLSLDADAQMLRLTVAQLTPKGFVGAALVNPLRGALLAVAAREANKRVPGMLNTLGGSTLEVNVRSILRRGLEDEGLRSMLARVLPLQESAELLVTGLEVDARGLRARVRGVA
jgi:hypothetical protein